MHLRVSLRLLLRDMGAQPARGRTEMSRLVRARALSVESHGKPGPSGVTSRKCSVSSFRVTEARKLWRRASLKGSQHSTPPAELVGSSLSVRQLLKRDSGTASVLPRPSLLGPKAVSMEVKAPAGPECSSVSCETQTSGSANCLLPCSNDSSSRALRGERSSCREDVLNNVRRSSKTRSRPGRLGKLGTLRSDVGAVALTCFGAATQRVSGWTSTRSRANSAAGSAGARDGGGGSNKAFETRSTPAPQIDLPAPQSMSCTQALVLRDDCRTGCAPTQSSCLSMRLPHAAKLPSPSTIDHRQPAPGP